MRFITVTLFTLFVLTSYAQKENFSVKFCPLALVDDVSFPTIEGGLEFKLSNKITWYNEIGIKYRKSYMDNDVDTNFIKSSGFKLKTEIRYYFQNDRAHPFEGSYLAANIFFTNDNHNNQIEYYPNGDTTRILTDAFGVSKNLLGLNLVFGHQKELNQRLLIDMYCGLGIRFRSVKTVNQEYNKATDINAHQSTDLNIPAIRLDIDTEPGNSIVPNLTLGLRLTYRL
jgi:hypothetical protein